jgi:SsrA-binding protein
MSKKKVQTTAPLTGKSKSPPGTGPTTRPPKMVAENRKARHKYEILDTIECGMMLLGSEVKSLRTGKCSLDEAYGRMKDGELWLVGCDIPEYKQATFWNHEPKRPRKLLLHKRQLAKFAGRASEKGLTLVPLHLYFNERGKAKCVMGLCKGLKVHDKREVLKKSDARREIDRAMRAKNQKR